MSVPYPACGDEAVHRSHEFGAGLASRHCPGWTVDQVVVRSLVTSVDGWLREHYGLSANFPDGLRLEMHPAVFRLLRTDPDLWERPGRETRVEDFFPVPVRVTPDLKQGSWRLVIVTEEVLMGGQMPETA